MKNLIKILAISALFSCSSKEENVNSNILENLSYSVDTVVVDAGEEIIVLGFGLGSHTFSPDKSRLYFFENEPSNLVEVDLDRLKLLKKTKFEKEGPNGVGSFLMGLGVGPSQLMYIYGYSSVGLFDQNGIKVRDLKFVPEGVESELANNFFGMFSGAKYDFETEKLFTQPPYENLQKYEFYVLDLKTKKAKSHSLPRMKIVSDFSRTLTINSDRGRGIHFFGPGRFTTSSPGEMILSTSAMSGFYHYDIAQDSLQFIDVQHQTHPNEVSFEIRQQPKNLDEMEEFRRKLEEHINYLEIHWDETREMYFRLGKKTFRGETKDDPTKFELFLFAYDRDFNVLGETKLEGLSANLYSYFFKDGKLWSYVNVEDELGFAVMTFDF